MQQNSVQSVERAFKILEILSEFDEGTGLMVIADRIGLHKTTVHRLLGTMQKLGYVHHKTNGKYTLGTQILFISRKILSGYDIINVAKPHLRKLRNMTNETVHLVVRSDNEAVYIDKLEPEHRTLRMHSSIGKRVPLYCTAVGKVILAHLNNSELKETWEIISPTIVKHTPATITTFKNMQKECSNIKKLGYGMDDEEHEKGIICISAPIFDANCSQTYALSVSAPKVRLTEALVDEYASYVKECAASVSAELGYIE